MTVAFLGARPAAEGEPIVGELREAAAAAGPMEFAAPDYRETRCVGMLPFTDLEERAEAFDDDVSARPGPPGVAQPGPRPLLPPPAGPPRPPRRLRAGAAAVAPARDRAALPGAAAPRPRRTGPRPLQSVRCRALPFPPAAERGAVFRDRNSSIGRLRPGGSRASTRRRPEPDRAAVRQGVRDEDERPGARVDGRRVDGIALARPRAGRGRPAARAHRRDLRPGVLGQDDARLPRD